MLRQRAGEGISVRRALCPTKRVGVLPRRGFGINAPNGGGDRRSGFAEFDAATTRVTEPQFARSQEPVNLDGTDRQNFFAQLGIYFAVLALVSR